MFRAEKKSSLQIICLGNRRPLKVLNDTKLILNDPSIWNHSKPSDVNQRIAAKISMNFECILFISKIYTYIKPLLKNHPKSGLILYFHNSPA